MATRNRGGFDPETATFRQQRDYLRTVLGLDNERFANQTLRFGYMHDGSLTSERYFGQVATVWLRSVHDAFGRKYAIVAVMPGDDLYGGSSGRDDAAGIEAGAREAGALFAKTASFYGKDGAHMPELLDALAAAMDACASHARAIGEIRRRHE